MRKINFGEVKINARSHAHINECVHNNYVTMGPKTAELEKKWGDLFNAKAVAVNSGTSACMAACMALYEYGAKPGDEIITPALSFIATSTAIRAAGFKPVWVDVKKETLNIDETLIEKAITKRTCAIMPVALMGKPPKMSVIKEIADKYKLKLIVDNCEGHGCKHQSKWMEDWADMVCYSCYAAHILFSGEFGFVNTKDEQLVDILKSVRSHGRPTGSLFFDHIRPGLNLKPTDLHASIGLGNIDDFGNIWETRKKILTVLQDQLSQYRLISWFSEQERGDINSPHAFSISFKTENSIIPMQTFLDDSNIEWKRNFGSIPEHPSFFKFFNGRGKKRYRNAEWVGNNGLHVGCHQYLTDNDVDYMIDRFSEFYGRYYS